MTTQNREYRLKRVILRGAFVCALVVFAGAGTASAESDVEKAGSFNACLQGWIKDRDLTWKTQQYSHGGDHTVDYGGGTTAVEHPDGSVDIETTEKDSKTGKPTKIKKRICDPGSKAVTPPDKPKPPEPPPPAKAGPDEVEAPPDLGALTPKETALLKCATPEELERIKAYQRAIEGLQRELANVLRPVEEADAAARAAEDEAYAFRTSVSEKEAAGPAFQTELKRLEDKANEMRGKLYDAKKAAEERVGELNNHINDTDQEMRSLLQDIEGRGPCPPPGTTEIPQPPEKPVRPGPGLPAPKEAFVMPELPDCFDDDKERQAFDDKVYDLFLEQINASSLASTPEERSEARQNADKLSRLRAKINSVPYCPAKRDKSHASVPDKNPLGGLLGHVTIGVGVGVGGSDNHHDHHPDRGGDDHHDAPTDDRPPAGTSSHD